MEKIEERIKKLEENQLKMAREYSKQGVAFFMTLAGMRIASLGEEKYREYEKYMRDNMDQTEKQINSAGDVGKVMALAAKSTDDCINYTNEKFR
ncbi:MAG TPA: hypothetical protein G4O19_03640 [Dehalococcoidia bacterium]|nr:hypothetical protein [Dehalococcoidia bacterium]